MRVLRQAVMTMALVAVIGPSAMACMAPEAQLTPAEHACCRRMARRCGMMSGRESHSCCKPDVRPAPAYVAAHHPDAAPERDAQPALTTQLQMVCAAGALVVTDDVATSAHAPPRLDPITVLRI